MSGNTRPHTEDGRPATYREVFATGEVRALFGSFTISKASSMLARIAITFLVFEATESPLLSAAAFGISYAPYLGPAQLLATVADRLPYRTTMVVADLARMVLIGLVAVPGMPLPVMLVLVFIAAMVEPAYDASRSALLPKLVSGETLTLALSVYLTLNQAAQLVGYLLGGVIAAIDPRIALLVDAATFGVSAIMLLTFVKYRPAQSDASKRKNIFKETGEGFVLVFRHRVLRTIALVVFTSITFAIIPEGVAAAWAPEAGGGAILQGTIMAAAPLAAIISSVIFTRFVKPSIRQKLIRPLVLVGPLALLPALLGPPGPVVVTIAVVCNLTLASIAPLNGIFVSAVPDGYRARAFSVMQSGTALIQGAAVLSVGILAQTALSVSQSVGLWGIAGVIVVAFLLFTWPSNEEFDKAVATDTIVTSSASSGSTSCGGDAPPQDETEKRPAQPAG